MLWTLAYRHTGPAVIISSLLAAVLAVITMMSISKLVIALSTTLVTSKRGKGAFYIFIVLTFVIICQLPNILVNSGIAFSLNTETWARRPPSPHGRRSVRPSNCRSTRLPELGRC